jgi:ribosomal protein S18 acetylase RimI-like enzyme
MPCIRDVSGDAAGLDFRQTRGVPIAYSISQVVSDGELNSLFESAWPNHVWRSFQPVLARSLCWITAHDAGALVGFVNLAWDGQDHAFVLDTTVRPDRQRVGIGRELVQQGIDYARQARLKWIHVDYEDPLKSFYDACGFTHTGAGVMSLEG